MKILALTIDAYGGRGGIAKFNRDLFDALLALPRLEQLRLLPRNAAPSPLPPSSYGPPRLVQSKLSSRGRLAFVMAALMSWLMARLGRYDRIICGHINLLPFALWIGAGKIPVDLIIHGVDAWQRPKRRLFPKKLDRVDRVLYVSELSAGRFRQWSGFPKSRMAHLPNSIDLERFTPGVPKQWPQAVPSGARVLMSLGRLEAMEAYKGIDQMLIALPEVLKRVPNAFYLIAGDGSDRPRLERLVAEAGLGEHVGFVGYIPEAQKLDYYRCAQAFVLAGFGEGFGIVLIEALACGLSVVGSRLDGSYEAVGEGRWGAAVDPNDSLELTDAVVAALQRGQQPQPPAELSVYGRSAFRQRVESYFADSA